VCGNGVVEPGEQCDGGECCAPACVFRGTSEQCGQESRPCHQRQLCNGREATCPAGDRLEPSGTPCIDEDDGCVLGACTLPDGRCEPRAVLCEVEAKALANGTPKARIRVTCRSDRESTCEATALADDAIGAAAAVDASPSVQAMLEEIAQPVSATTRRKARKGGSLRFKRVLVLRLNVRGKELLQKGDLFVRIVVTVQRGEQRLQAARKSLTLQQIRR
jgi:hypothetical protein